MPNKNEENDSWSLSSAFKKVNKFILTVPGLMGLPFYFIAADAAAKEVAINPDATLLDVGERFYGGLYDITVENFIPGTSFILSEIFNVAADIAVPGAGMIMQAIGLTNNFDW